MAKGNLPDFIGIGAQKAGTTWLYQQLQRHPQIHAPAKELSFFHKDLPLDWYRERLSGAQPGQLIGDISPRYGAAPGIAARIAAACPDVRLLMLIRDPVDRAWSQYKMASRLGNIPRGMPFLDAFHADRQWLQRRGRYAEIIAEFTGRFPGRLLVLDFERIACAPAELLADVYRFLGIDPICDPVTARTVFAANRDPLPILASDAEQVAIYYRPHNASLRKVLPWNPRWIDR